ncbi:DNA polymerase IV [Pseudoroseomonas wenyumeiae]|uniref:DNA polymerase IV n=1 Tax=Teichococcus wenyumeiae TaxID=2478470 RepID=A0A3A9JE77_9PROT|nr:DNA polymerase IV [Pseudoroseomonas wenyumeiae]RKK02865.1 DNA polymerase IV [Pseudoroseomonas wenyumeiae]RMI25412.1 DNA polymerase IV [Pseudoroseomonas wenyumeiae]
MPTLCRDCLSLSDAAGPACAGCGSRRRVAHAELTQLSIAHIDCDAFFASVEKRDRPELRAKPLIVGGGKRGVVAACCYIARTRGVRSAMPMFKALSLCPDAVVVKPEMAKYSEAGHRIRAMMQDLTPLVQPMSIDEAVLDLSGTEALHKRPPAAVLAGLALRVEREVGVTISVGLAPNRLLAKLAVERDKPRGFAVIGAREAAAILAPEPVTVLPGVGPVLARKLAAQGFSTLGQLQQLSVREAAQRFGEDGPALAARARGEDSRPVDPHRETKSISAETTFESDIADLAALEIPLWRMCEKLARRLRQQGFAAGGVVLKLKTAGFALRTRHARLHAATRLPDTLFAAARPLLAKEADGTAFRLIGIGAQPLVDGGSADRGDLLDAEAPRRAARWQAIEALRAKFGEDVVVKGRGR